MQYTAENRKMDRLAKTHPAQYRGESPIKVKKLGHFKAENTLAALLANPVQEKW